MSDTKTDARNRYNFQRLQNYLVGREVPYFRTRKFWN